MVDGRDKYGPVNRNCRMCVISEQIFGPQLDILRVLWCLLCFCPENRALLKTFNQFEGVISFHVWYKIELFSIEKDSSEHNPITLLIFQPH